MSSVTGHGKTKPAVMLSNDFEISMEHLVRKYSRRWLVEKIRIYQIIGYAALKISSGGMHANIFQRSVYDFVIIISCNHHKNNNPHTSAPTGLIIRNRL